MMWCVAQKDISTYCIILHLVNRWNTYVYVNRIFHWVGGVPHRTCIFMLFRFNLDLFFYDILEDSEANFVNKYIRHYREEPRKEETKNVCARGYICIALCVTIDRINIFGKQMISM